MLHLIHKSVGITWKLPYLDMRFLNLLVMVALLTQSTLGSWETSSERKFRGTLSKSCWRS